MIIIVAVIVLSTQGARERSEKQKAVDDVAQMGILKVGLRADLGSLCSFNTETGQFEGLEKDVIDMVLGRLFDEEDAMIITFEEVNSNTKDALILTGELDIALGASIAGDSSSIEYTTSFFADPGGFLVMEGDISDQSELEGKIVGYVQDTYAARENEEKVTKLEEYLISHGISAQIKKYASYPEAVDALYQGHISAVCASGEHLKLYGKKGMLILPERFMPHEYSIEMRSSLASFCDAMSDEIKAMKEDGTMSALIDKWNLVDYYELTEER